MYDFMGHAQGQPTGARQHMHNLLATLVFPIFPSIQPPILPQFWSQRSQQQSHGRAACFGGQHQHWRAGGLDDHQRRL